MNVPGSVLSLLQKVEETLVPVRRKDANPDSYRDRKELICNYISLVQLCAFAPLWLKSTFRNGVNVSSSRFLSGTWNFKK